MKLGREIVRPAVTLLLTAMAVSFLVTLVYQFTRTEPAGFPEDALQAASDLVQSDELTELPADYPEGVEGAVCTKDQRYVIASYGQGYGGKIRLVTAFDSSGVILGIQVVSASETPGIGSKVVEGDEFISTLIGKQGELALGETVDGVAGATVSSKGVISAVNLASSVLDAVQAEASKKGE